MGFFIHLDKIQKHLYSKGRWSRQPPTFLINLS
nr:MAG TPA: hypothetical protein [Caudoviricetes sp.]